MSYRDEERINTKKELEKIEEEKQKEKELNEGKEPSSIYDEYIVLDGKQLSFERKEIEDLGVSMYMPKEFKLMSDDMKEILFARTKPPKYAYYGDEISFSIAVNITESPLKKTDVKNFLNLSPRIIESMVPQAQVLRTYLKDDEDFPVGNAEFISGGFDGKVYNLMLFASVNEKLVVINMGFGNHDKKSVLPVTQEMAASLQLEENKDESDNV